MHLVLASFCAPCRALAVIATANWAVNTRSNLEFAMHHILNRPCPVTSRIRPRASINARLRWTAARPPPVMAAAIEADKSGNSDSAARKTGGVLPEAGVFLASARAVRPCRPYCKPFTHPCLKPRSQCTLRRAVSSSDHPVGAVT